MLCGPLSEVALVTWCELLDHPLTVSPCRLWHQTRDHEHAVCTQPEILNPKTLVENLELSPGTMFP